MLVFCALTPHSPLLVEAVGKEHTAKLDATRTALASLEADFYASQPETVIILTPHGRGQEKNILVNFSPDYKGHLQEFGDFATKDEFEGDNAFCFSMKERLETSFPLQVTTSEELDHGTFIPLYFLTAHHKKAKVLPISFSGAPLAEHFEFGKALGDYISESPKRIAVVASSELSHKLTKLSPQGYSPAAKKFDQKVIELLKAKNFAEFLALDAKQIERVAATELRALAILLGIIAEKEFSPELLSYEGPYGVGYVVMNFHLH